MIAMRKNEKSTDRGNVKRQRKSLGARNKGAGTKRVLELNDVKKAKKPLKRNKPSSETSVIDKKRVDAIRRAIKKGDYKIDCNRTADKLLQLEDEIWGDR